MSQMRTSAAASGPAVGSWRWSSGRHLALGLDFGVRSTDAGLGAHVEAALASLAAPGEPALWYSVLRAGGDWELWVGDEPEPRLVAPDEGRLAAMLFWQLNQDAVASVPDRLVLHAAAVERGGRAVVLPGPPDSGKTTLTAGLVRAGFGYLTDEAVVFDPESLAVQPFPKALALGPDVAAGLTDLCAPGADLGGQWRVDPGSIRPGAVGSAAPPALVVTPRFERGAIPRLEPLTPGEAVVLMAEHSFNLLDLGQAALDVLAAVACRAPAYRLVTGDLPGAVALVTEALA